MDSSNSGRINQLARLHGVQTAYYDVTHQRKQASVDSLLAILQALDAPVSSPKDIVSVLRERKQSLYQRMLEPVTVIWSGETAVIRVCLPEKIANRPLEGRLEMESGEQLSYVFSADNSNVIKKTDIEGMGYIVKQFNLPDSLPSGYHRFHIEAGGNHSETLIIAAPATAYIQPRNNTSRAWGVFIPPYALHDGNSISGDYSTLGSLVDWISTLGGNVLATLPLLPSFVDEPFDPGPYAPVSRLLWNEFYINLEVVPELNRSQEATAILHSESVLSEISELRKMPLMDYRRTMALKRRVLEACCQYMISESTERTRAFTNFIRANPIVENYACFRATIEKQYATWLSWPQRMQIGDLQEGDYDEKNKLYYMYAQWVAHEQLKKLSRDARDRGVSMYFDLPLGTHKDGYDVWRERNSFSLEATVGAPPDTVFTWGQNWLFPPPHPDRIRDQGYSYFRAYIQHHLKYAGMLRIDHVMGLHRLFWIPKNLNATQGVYVKYRADELYAILTLESQRYRSILVGENLGTVPAYVNSAISRHRFQKMYVLHYELADNTPSLIHHPKRNSVASLNTHDMPPFASFWQSMDIPERKSLGLLDDKNARTEEQLRRTVKKNLLSFLQNHGWLTGECNDIQSVLRACLKFLSASRARFVLVNLEDLWLETQSQNIPSTDDRNPNWRHKARYSFDEFCRISDIRVTLGQINSLRKRSGT